MPMVETKSTRFLRRCAIALLALIVSPEGFGQELIEEIVVTAQKREQSVLEIPISVQAFPSELVNALNMRDFSEVITLVPSASEEISSTPSQRRYQVRGVAQGGNSNDPTVGYYVNDSAYFIYGQNFAPITRTFDLERIEVLRGPQSTLYGNGSMGGTVRFITRKPNLSEFDARLRAGYSDTDGGEAGDYIDAAVNIPVLEDVLALRLVGSSQNIGGYQEDVFGNEDINDAEISTYRAEVLWQLTDSLSASFLYSRDEGDSMGGRLLSELDPPIATSFPGDFNNNKQELIAATIDWKLSFASLTSTTSVIDTKLNALFNIPFPGLPDDVFRIGQANDGEALNNETRLVSTGNSRLQWLAGIYYTDSSTTDALTYNALLPDAAQDFESESISIFGEVSYSLFDGALIPLVGLRYFEDDRNTVTQPGNLGLESATFDSWNPRFNLQWIPSDQTNVYLNVAKGFRSGTFNLPTVCNFHSLDPTLGGGGLPCENRVDSDELWSYEVGTKWVSTDAQWVLEVAGYFMDWKDIRQNVPFSGLFAVYSVGDAEIKGIDFLLRYSPAAIEGLGLQLSANVNESEFTNLEPNLAAIAGTQEGDELPFAPSSTLAITVDYSRSVFGDSNVHASLGYRHIAGQRGLYGGTIVGDDRDLLNARLALSFGDFGVALFGNNLLGEDGIVFSQNPTGGSTFFTQDYPRQIGIEVNYGMQ